MLWICRNHTSGYEQTLSECILFDFAKSIDWLVFPYRFFGAKYYFPPMGIFSIIYFYFIIISPLWSFFQVKFCIILSSLLQLLSSLLPLLFLLVAVGALVFACCVCCNRGFSGHVCHACHLCHSCLLSMSIKRCRPRCYHIKRTTADIVAWQFFDSFSIYFTADNSNGQLLSPTNKNYLYLG